MCARLSEWQRLHRECVVHINIRIMQDEPACVSSRAGPSRMELGIYAIDGQWHLCLSVRQQLYAIIGLED